MKLILPKTLCVTSPNDGPLIFLAGPVRGGGDWQKTCCELIAGIIPDFHAVIPCRYAPDHPLYAHRMPGDETFFDRQLTWERHYLEKASQEGCILFWLPEESTTDPHPRENGDSYAMDTRGELGEWRGRLMHNPMLPVVIGAEAGFPGLSQIQRNFNQALQCDFPIYPTLGATVAAALHKVV